jgi:thioredoxin 1
MLWKLLIGAGVGALLGGLMGHLGRCRTGTCPITSNPLGGALFGALLGAALFHAVLPGFASLSSSGVAPGVRQIASSTELDKTLAATDGPVLVDFYSPSCPPCRRLGPVIEKLADDYEGKAAVVKVNVNKARDLAARYGIRSIPTVILFVDGQPTEPLVGLRPEETYRELLNNAIASPSADAEEL